MSTAYCRVFQSKRVSIYNRTICAGTTGLPAQSAWSTNANLCRYNRVKLIRVNVNFLDVLISPGRTAETLPLSMLSNTPWRRTQPQYPSSEIYIEQLEIVSAVISG